MADKARQQKGAVKINPELGDMTNGPIFWHGFKLMMTKNYNGHEWVSQVTSCAKSYAARQLSDKPI